MLTSQLGASSSLDAKCISAFSSEEHCQKAQTFCGDALHMGMDPLLLNITMKVRHPLQANRPTKSVFTTGQSPQDTCRNQSPRPT